jgi:hypothetical protein
MRKNKDPLLHELHKSLAENNRLMRALIARLAISERLGKDSHRVKKNPNKKLALMAKLGIKQPKGMPLHEILLSKIHGRPYLRCRAYKGIGAVEGYITISEYRALTKARKQFFKAYLPLLKTFNNKRINIRHPDAAMDAAIRKRDEALSKIDRDVEDCVYGADCERWHRDVKKVLDEFATAETFYNFEQGGKNG